jgi:hypothetical protein
MSRYEVWDNRGRIDTPNPSPTLHRLDTVSQNGLLVILVSDVNERDHESFCTGSGIFVAQIEVAKMAVADHLGLRTCRRPSGRVPKCLESRAGSDPHFR